MTDQELHIERIIGEMAIVLEFGSPEEKSAMLADIADACGAPAAAKLEAWAKAGFDERNQ